MNMGNERGGVAVKKFVVGAAIVVVLATAGGAAADDVMVTKAPPPSSIPTDFDWTGFYAGGHLGYAWGSSNWTGARCSGSLDLAQPVDTFAETGSFFEGLQAGYNYMLPNRVLIGAEIDASFPAFQNLAGISIGGISNFTSPTLGPVSYSETVLSSGTVRGRIGYAPGNWLFYATGGFAWSYDQLTLTQLASGTTDMPFLWRLGWAAGAGVEVPVLPHWTARLEYLFTDYGTSGVLFANAGQRFNSDFSLQELRAGLNYQFGNDPLASGRQAPAAPDTGPLNFHGQTTFVWQGYPAIRSPYAGPIACPAAARAARPSTRRSMPACGCGRAPSCGSTPRSIKASVSTDSHGAAGFPSAEAYKLGDAYPYARVQRYFVRQTIDLGGETQKVDADINQFAGSQTANRLVLTVGKFAVVDIFDTNKYANNAKSDFLNWSVVNAGSFDYAGDGWGYSYGAAAEWYQGRWTLRGGIFDLSATPAGGISPTGADLDPTFDQFQLVGEIEERHELWGSRASSRSPDFSAAGGRETSRMPLRCRGDRPARRHQRRAHVYQPARREPQSGTAGFARIGACSPAPAGPTAMSSRGISPTSTAPYRQASRSTANNGAGPTTPSALPASSTAFPACTQAFSTPEASASWSATDNCRIPGSSRSSRPITATRFPSSMKVSFDYQFIANPAYNADRGPVNVFAGPLPRRILKPRIEWRTPATRMASATWSPARPRVVRRR